MYALCDAAGVIYFKPKFQSRRGRPGLLPIAKGPEGVLRDEISAVARHAYDGVTLLVPGVPETPDKNVAVDKLRDWMEWARPSLEEKGLIVF